MYIHLRKKKIFRKHTVSKRNTAVPVWFHYIYIYIVVIFIISSTILQ